MSLDHANFRSIWPTELRLRLKSSKIQELSNVCWDQAVRRYVLKPSPIYYLSWCVILSFQWLSYLLPYAFTFCHDSFPSLGAVPYMSQFYCHLSLLHLSHASALFTASSYSLSFSPFHVPPLSDCIDYVILLRPSPFSTPLARHSSPHDPHSLTSTSVFRLSVRRLVCGRWASAERRQSSLTVCPIHQHLTTYPKPQTL